MGISTKTRKNLWGKSGNRCSICKTELFAKKSATNEVNIGEECHIISEKPNGPRFRPNLSEYNNYENLILLCRNHHKEIDELFETFSEEVLQFIKTNHENWVSNTLNKAVDNDKEEQPRFLARITTGKELLNIVHNSHGYRTDYDQMETEADAQYIGGVIQELIDYGDISGMVEAYDRVQMAFQLNDLLKDLESKGYYIFGEQALEYIGFKEGDKAKWTVATLVIRKIENL
ncbi:HNH endonuclease [Zobellia nedashkovskayae]|uniref:HNH endonuclease n=1 Tax=Zobellia nedashkovskayae TaxID=2779510 RepID=UPI00188C4003|nr:HNH endonuclease [Zobellia nedashkovskayae]